LPPPRFPSAAYFVRQSDPTQEIRERLDQRGCVWLHDIESIPGTGKTMFLTRFYDAVKESGEGEPAWVSLSAVHAAPKDDGTIESLERDFYAFCDVVSLYAKDLGFSDMVGRITTIREATADIPTRNVVIEQNVKMGILSRIEGSTFHWDSIELPDDEPPPDFFRRTVDRARLGIRDDFVALVNELSRTRRPVLFADDFECALTGRLGDWFVELVSLLEDAVVLMARAESLRVLGGLSGSLVEVKLSNFDSDDVRRFLEDRLERTELPAGLADRVEAVTGGHPEAVYVATQLAGQYGIDRPDLLDVFEDVRGELQSRLGTLVNRLLGEIGEEDVRRAVEVGSILRRFDTRLLNYMLERDEEEEPLIDDVLEFAFTERHLQPDTNEFFYRFHEFIRKEQDERLARTKPDLYEKLHTRAAIYYSTWLTECEDEDRDPAAYCRAYRYEAPEWQDMVNEWLYHLSRIDARQAALEMARVYFGAFWWWGCYLQFPFCERLLREGEFADSHAEVSEVVGLLRAFHASYPPEAEPEAVDADWLKVEDALAEVERIERRTKEIPDEDAADRRRQLRAYLNVFTAHALRGQDAPVDGIEKAYQDAQELFAGSEDVAWSVPWVLYERGDLALEHGDAGEAAAKARAALELVLTADFEERDNEVAANAYRLLGDAAWKSDDIDEAFANYQLAALYAYAFQGLPKPADFYTIRFFAHIAEHVLKRLRELPERVPDERAPAIVERMHAFWSEYWRRAGEPSLDAEPATLLAEGRVDQLAPYVLPAFPTEADTGPGAGYVLRARTVADRTCRTVAKM
jgi:hypothetical protein